MAKDEEFLEVTRSRLRLKLDKEIPSLADICFVVDYLSFAIDILKGFLKD